VYDVGEGGEVCGVAWRVVSQGDGDVEGALVGVGVRARDGEGAAAAADRAAGAGAVTPVDGGAEVAGGVGGVGVAEGCHRPGETEIGRGSCRGRVRRSGVA